MPSHKKLIYLLVFVTLLMVSWISIDFTTPYPIVVPQGFGGRFSIPSDNPMTKEGVELGRHLFYETRLSSSSKISCATCHQQQKAFTDGLARSIGIERRSSNRNSMSLVNLLWSRKFFWDGRSESLEEQSLFPLTNDHEMGQALDVSARRLAASDNYPGLFKKAFGDSIITASRIAKAIAQFERTLISSNSRYDQFLRGEINLKEEEIQGMLLFQGNPQPALKIRAAGCAHCHGGVKMYKELFHNNGLDVAYSDKGIELLTGYETDHGRFKAPTLRNIELTAPYMHDGRFNSLEEVVDHYNGILPERYLSPFIKGITNDPGAKTLALRAEEKAALIAFLKTLTDSTFIHNPNFSNPFQSVKTK